MALTKTQAVTLSIFTKADRANSGYLTSDNTNTQGWC